MALWTTRKQPDGLGSIDSAICQCILVWKRVLVIGSVVRVGWGFRTCGALCQSSHLALRVRGKMFCSVLQASSAAFCRNLASHVGSRDGWKERASSISRGRTEKPPIFRSSRDEIQSSNNLGMHELGNQAR